MLRENNSTNVALGSDDLELLERFLEAWCEENGVDKTSPKAQNIASSLFDWYQFDLADRTNLKSGPPTPLPESKELDSLLKRLKAA
ncbi:hypothetical protein [Aliirhizobium smilacinae]|jgi:hypothetical protein|uniref:Uncharacterized protein n=1 Tax=Aliirhizobium smilacinae TaxID=1395944 RepID=A0A5C4XHT8_9HYPH|nr:hypothetical protein [Rhizobium smilacinae]TNM62144.1 hypothetical protein FHP24_18805 [Rhizobium smilacinae]